jgi:hypothetical protein
MHGRHLCRISAGLYLVRGRNGRLCRAGGHHRHHRILARHFCSHPWLVELFVVIGIIGLLAALVLSTI